MPPNPRGSHDGPLDEIRKECDEIIRAGGMVWQKWTCERCGVRLTMDVPNALFLSGQCDRCGHVTSLKQCGFKALLGVGNDPALRARLLAVSLDGAPFPPLVNELTEAELQTFLTTGETPARFKPPDDPAPDPRPAP